MKMFPGRLRAAFVLLLLCLAVVWGNAARAADSPTGRNPLLNWTSARQDVWNQMVATNDPEWLNIQAIASGKKSVSDDFGQVATLAYQMTGDPRYAARAWQQIGGYIQSHTFPSSDTANRIRILGYRWVQIFDWLHPWLQQQGYLGIYVSFINWMGDTALNCFQLHNANGTAGCYMCLAAIDLATAGDNPRAGTFLTAPIKDQGVTKSVGGLTATGANFDTARNALAFVGGEADDGIDPEGSEYVYARMIPLFLGMDGIKTATGQDYFPEWTAALPALGRGAINTLTPDLADSFQIGDCQDVHNLALDRRLPYLTMLGYLLQGTQEGANVLYLRDLLRKQGSPGGRYWLLYQPGLPTADWRPGWSNLYGLGFGITRNGWDNTATAVCFGMPQQTYLNHTNYLSYQTFWLWRKGQWAIGAPVGYGGPGNTSDAENTLTLFGLRLSAMQTKGAVVNETLPLFMYQVGTTYGPYYAGSYKVPPPFVNEWTRELVWLGSADKTIDTVVCFDRLDMQDPRTLPNFSYYGAAEQAQINASVAGGLWHINTPVLPATDSGGFGWSLPDGQVVRVNHFLPTDCAQRSVAVSSFGGYGFVNDGEMDGWLQDFAPAAFRGWDTHLNSVHVADPGVVCSDAYVASDGGEVQGVQLHCGSHIDQLCLFNAQQGQRLRQSGYTVRVTAPAAGLRLYCADLDPGRQWSVTIDGRTMAIAVSAAGMARFNVRAGSHTVSLSAQ